MEAIAIVGMGCRFPNAQDPEAFWSLLRDGVDTITEVSSNRWDIDALYDPKPGTPGKTVSRWGGFLDKVDYFDANFFNISASNAKRIDPHQRLVLEVAWESLENAGIVPTKLAGSQTGVFIGMSPSDYNRLIYNDISGIKAEDSSQPFLCFVPNRLSYFLNLQGPSLAIDTACSSSLVAVHLACQSLRSGECNVALAGGVSLRLSPEPYIALSLKGMLSPKGRCKTFDASADGYVRGEGCGIFVLKRLCDALKDGDNVLATIRGSAVNSNGLSNGITSPNGLAQQNLIRQALENAKVTPEQISFVETQGTASFLGDAIEYQALKAVLMQNRKPSHTCWLGSVKTNIGHLEAASGMASLIKVVLSLQHQQIPPNLHLEQLNPYISLEGTSFSIPTEIKSWTANTEGRFAGVSSFGFGGTNSHIILAQTLVSSQRTANKIDRPLHILTLSAQTEKALLDLATRYIEKLQNFDSEVSLADICFTANTGRVHFDYRLAVVAESNQVLSEKLAAFVSGRKIVGRLLGQTSSRKQPKVVFLFPNQGSQFAGMTRQLFETQPTFQATVDRCQEILRPCLAKPLLELFYPETQADTELVLFVLEYALAELWKSWGIKPDAVMGYGVGEYVAACVAGVFSLEDALKLVAQSESLMQSQSQAAAFQQVASELTYSSPQINIISPINGQKAKAEIATPEYWYRQIQQPIPLADNMKVLNQQGYEVFVEIGPQESKSLPEGVGICLSSLSEGQEDWQQMLQSLGMLYVQGVPVDWSGFDRDYHRQRRSLPTYPFQRQRYWFQDTNYFYQTPSSPNGTSTQELESDCQVSSELTSDIQLETSSKNGAAKLTQPVSTLSAQSIQNWIVDWLGRNLKVEAEDIKNGKSEKSFLDYGLKSLGAVNLAKDLERFLGRSLEATIVWNFPTVESLVSHLADDLNLPVSKSPLNCEQQTTSDWRSLDKNELETPHTAKISGTPTEARNLPPVIAVSLSSQKDLDRQHQQELANCTPIKHTVAKKGMQFSLLYFASKEAELNSDEYRLFIEGAKFADKYGLTAVWIPERHFHAFGGLYPNPAVLGSALSMVTERIRIRAGSVVLPLQNPVRVAEEWAVVDKLSQGRVDIAFARGWNPNDFVLAPDNFANSAEVMFSGIETVQKLWRGESISLLNGVGKETEIRIYPLPKQREIPIWITCTGGKERFIEAGAIGANVLTALLFQPLEELAEKIALYRESRANNSYDPDAGHVTLMLHTFIGEDMGLVRHKVRKPFIAYLESSVNLWQHGIKSLEGLDEKEKEHLLAYAFERYFQTSALIGTPETCLEMVRQMKTVGVDEIACLIDFGIDEDSVMASLYSLKKLKEQSELLSVPSTDVIINKSLLVEEKTSANIKPSQKSPYWIIDPQSKPDARLRLFCLPYAGGDISVFRNWSNSLPPDIEVYALQLSGKTNLGSKLPGQLTPLVEDLAQFLLPYLDKVFAFYGHSLGGLINFELCRYLRRNYNLKPIHFFVGAQHAPQLPYPYPLLENLTHCELLEFVKDLTTIELPESIGENDALLQSLLATLKTSSLIQNENYCYTKEEPLDCPITSFGGWQDKFLTQEHLCAWRIHTNRSFKLEMLIGNHLFLEDRRNEILPSISQELLNLTNLL